MLVSAAQPATASCVIDDRSAVASNGDPGPRDGSLQQRLEQLTRLRRDEGYITSCSPEDDGLSWRLQEVHCSVQRIAEEFPAVCDQELLLIRRTVPDCRVERVHWRLEGGHACGFRITPIES